MTPRLTAEGMRKVAHNIRTSAGSGSQFVCIEAMRVHIPYRHAAEWIEHEARLKDTLHALLRRDGFLVDGCWREQRRDEHSYTAFCDANHKERIEWCEKIADELEAQEYQAYLDSGHA